MKKRIKLLSIIPGVAALAAFQLTALAANDTLTYSVSPTTHSSFSTVTSVLTTNPPASSHLTSSTTTLPLDETVCHASDGTCSPANNTAIGTASVKAQFICGFTSTNTYTISWINPPDTGYTPPTGETVVAETSANTPFSATKTYVTVDGSSQYRLHTPSYPNLVCAGTSAQITITLGKNGTNTYNINKNPTTVGTFTVNQSDTYSNNSTNTASATFTTT